jgi:hypothetical protein
MAKIICWLFGHKWSYSYFMGHKFRKCARCGMEDGNG